MIGFRIGGVDLPDAVSTPSGMPDISTEDREAANAQLLWRAVLETIRHSDTPSPAEHRHGVAGFLWRGNPRELAEKAWDGLDRSDLAEEALAALYAYLHRTGHLTRNDTGNKGRQWWVAGQWEPGRTVEEAPPAEDEYPTAAAVLDVSVSGKQEQLLLVPVGGEPDYAAVLQKLLNEHRELQAEHRRALAKASLAGGTVEDLSAEIISLRGMNEELRANNTRLRAENAAYRVILNEPLDDTHDS